MSNEQSVINAMQLEDPKLWNQENLIVEVTEALARAMNQRKITKAQLAEKLGCSRARVTQVLGGGKNLTLRTLADFMLALDFDIEIDLLDRRCTAEGTPAVTDLLAFTPPRWREPRQWGQPMRRWAGI
jgi:transcriptional regulator with XRE-family HTH domain